MSAWDRIREEDAWTEGSPIRPSELEQIDANLAKAPNFAEGGAYAPTSAVDIGGASALKVDAPVEVRDVANKTYVDNASLAATEAAIVSRVLGGDFAVVGVADEEISRVLFSRNPATGQTAACPRSNVAQHAFAFSDALKLSIGKSDFATTVTAIVPFALNGGLAYVVGGSAHGDTPGDGLSLWVNPGYSGTTSNVDNDDAAGANVCTPHVGCLLNGGTTGAGLTTVTGGDPEFFTVSTTGMTFRQLTSGTWSTIPAVNGKQLMASNDADIVVAVIGGSDGTPVVAVYLSVNGGVTWQRQANLTSEASGTLTALDVRWFPDWGGTGGKFAAIVTHSSSWGRIYTSADGATWALDTELSGFTSTPSRAVFCCVNAYGPTAILHASTSGYVVKVHSLVSNTNLLTSVLDRRAPAATIEHVGWNGLRAFVCHGESDEAYFTGV